MQKWSCILTVSEATQAFIPYAGYLRTYFQGRVYLKKYKSPQVTAHVNRDVKEIPLDSRTMLKSC